MTAAEEDSRWAQALVVLGRMSPEPPHRPAARQRFDRRAARVAVAMAASAVLLVLASLVLDPPPDSVSDPPAWRVVAGIAVAVLGLCLFAVRWFRPYGSRPWIVRPLDELTRSQRKHLLEQVHGREPAVPERLPLARVQAESLLEQRWAVWGQTGLAIVFAGAWVIDRSIWRTLLTLAMVGATVVGVVVARREQRHARRFLEEHG